MLFSDNHPTDIWHLFNLTTGVWLCATVADQNTPALAQNAYYKVKRE